MTRSTNWWRIRSERPPLSECSSLLLTPEQVKVIILDNGESKYGLAYHTPPHCGSISIGLCRVLDAISADLGPQFRRPRYGDLRGWHSKGIFLHVNNQRWSKVTYEALRQLSQSRNPIVWMLWGGRAQEFSALVPDHHLLLCTGDPRNPRGNVFLPSNHFSKCAEFLNEDPIKFWSL